MRFTDAFAVLMSWWGSGFGQALAAKTVEAASVRPGWKNAVADLVVADPDIRLSRRAARQVREWLDNPTVWLRLLDYSAHAAAYDPDDPPPYDIVQSLQDHLGRSGELINDADASEIAGMTLLSIAATAPDEAVTNFIRLGRGLHIWSGDAEQLIMGIRSYETRWPVSEGTHLGPSRAPYRQQIRRYLDFRTRLFVGREAEIFRYATQPPDTAVLIEGGPGEGKTSLLAMVLDRWERGVWPGGERPELLYFFVDAEGARASAHDFLVAVVGQLIDRLDRSEPIAEEVPALRSQLVALWSLLLETEPERILFLLDGLDEQHDEYPAIIDVLADLPVERLALVCTSRPNPDPIRFVRPEHPLRGAMRETIAPLSVADVIELLRGVVDERHVADLAVKVQAITSGNALYLRSVQFDIQERGLIAVEELITYPPRDVRDYFDRQFRQLSRVASDIAWEAIGMMLAARAPIALDDLALLLGVSPIQLSSALTPVQRYLLTDPAIRFNHLEMATRARAAVGDVNLAASRARLLEWAWSYSEDEWRSTPAFVVRTLAEMLDDDERPNDLLMLATPGWYRAHRRFEDTDRTFVLDMRRVLRFDIDLVDRLTVSYLLARLRSPFTSLPAGTISGWIRVGNTDRATALADLAGTDAAWSELAIALAPTDRRGAQRAASRVVDSLARARTCAVLGELWLKSLEHRESGERLLRRALELLDGDTKSASGETIRANIARDLLLNTTHPDTTLWSMIKDPLTVVRVRAAMISVASDLDAAGAHLDAANEVLDRLVRESPWRRHSAGTLEALASAVASLGAAAFRLDPSRGLEFLTRSRTLALKNTDPYTRAVALGAVAAAAANADPDFAAEARASAVTESLRVSDAFARAKARVRLADYCSECDVRTASELLDLSYGDITRVSDRRLTCRLLAAHIAVGGRLAPSLVTVAEDHAEQLLVAGSEITQVDVVALYRSLSLPRAVALARTLLGLNSNHAVQLAVAERLADHGDLALATEAILAVEHAARVDAISGTLTKSLWLESLATALITHGREAALAVSSVIADEATRDRLLMQIASAHARDGEWSVATMSLIGSDCLRAEAAATLADVSDDDTRRSELLDQARWLLRQLGPERCIRGCVRLARALASGGTSRAYTFADELCADPDNDCNARDHVLAEIALVTTEVFGYDTAAPTFERMGSVAERASAMARAAVQEVLLRPDQWTRLLDDLSRPLDRLRFLCKAAGAQAPADRLPVVLRALEEEMVSQKGWLGPEWREPLTQLAQYVADYDVRRAVAIAQRFYYDDYSEVIASISLGLSWSHPAQRVLRSELWYQARNSLNSRRPERLLTVFPALSRISLYALTELLDLLDRSEDYRDTVEAHQCRAIYVRDEALAQESLRKVIAAKFGNGDYTAFVRHLVQERGVHAALRLIERSLDTVADITEWYLVAGILAGLSEKLSLHRQLSLAYDRVTSTDSSFFSSPSDVANAAM